GRHVAVKLLAPRLGGDDLTSRVLDEGRVLASVKHPNIVVVHGADEHDGRVGLWMEFVRGRTLAAEVDARGAHSADEATAVERALAPDPAARFATAGEFEEALAGAAAGTTGRFGVAAKQRSSGASARRRSPRLQIGLAAVAVLALGTTVGLWRWAGVAPLP